MFCFRGDVIGEPVLGDLRDWYRLCCGWPFRRVSLNDRGLPLRSPPLVCWVLVAEETVLF